MISDISELEFSEDNDYDFTCFINEHESDISLSKRYEYLTKTNHHKKRTV